jgi:prevent-host-death family protein
MQDIEEISVRELSRHTCGVLTRVRERNRMIVTRHGHPIAVLLSIDDCIELVLTHGEPIPHHGERARHKKVLLRRLLGERLHMHAFRLQRQRMSRGRWPEAP